MTKPLSEMTRSELVDACIKGQQRSADLAAHVEAAKGIMHRLIETECYMRGPRPPAVQEYLDGTTSRMWRGSQGWLVQ